MKDNLTVYKIWAPDSSKWAGWAKPVLFSAKFNHHENPLVETQINWPDFNPATTMAVVDLPGAASVNEGLAYAKKGFRPVPLYNGVYLPTSGTMVVKVADIVWGLFHGADVLEQTPISPDAPPVFLLDANRLQGKGKQPGTFDNRWAVFPQDMPSAVYLGEHNIKDVVVRAKAIQPDLSHILYRYQQAGIGIHLLQSNGQAQPVCVTRPNGFKIAWLRFKVITGLSRNATGGFGSVIPVPEKGRTYGYG